MFTSIDNILKLCSFPLHRDVMFYSFQAEKSFCKYLFLVSRCSLFFSDQSIECLGDERKR